MTATPTRSGTRALSPPWCPDQLVSGRLIRLGWSGAGLGLLFTPLTLTSLSRVDYADAGLASSLINTGQVVGGSIGLAILGTVAWTVVVNTARNAAHAAGSAAHAAGSAQVSGHALAAGFSRGFEVSAAIMVLALVVAAIMIRVNRQDLTGAQP